MKNESDSVLKDASADSTHVEDSGKKEAASDSVLAPTDGALALIYCYLNRALSRLSCDSRSHDRTEIALLQGAVAELEGLKPKHECEIIARAPDMAPGRDWWIGRLTKPVFVRGIEEKFCLHLKTPLKDVVFLLNEADLGQIATLMGCAQGKPIFDGWVAHMMIRAFAAANKEQGATKSKPLSCSAEPRRCPDDQAASRSPNEAEGRPQASEASVWVNGALTDGREAI